MDDGRFFAFVAGLATLFWLLSGRRALDPTLRRLALLAAYVSLAVGILYALAKTVAWVLG